MEHKRPTQEDVDLMVPKWDKVLLEIEENLKSNISSKNPKLIQAEFVLNELMNTMMGIKHFLGLNVPQFYIEKTTDLMNQVKHVGMGKDEKAWNSYLISKIQILKDILQETRPVNKDILRDVISSVVKKITDTFDKYKNLFSSENMDLRDEYDRLIAGIEQKYGIMLREQTPLEIDVLTPDKVLDLYEEIQGMKPGKKKEEKKRLLKEWQKQIVSNLNKRLIISRRDEPKKHTWQTLRRNWGPMNPTERVHETGPKEGQEEREAIKEGLREYEEEN